jgi:hypothetical protein
MTAKPLTFSDVDELGFAAGRGLLDLGQLDVRYRPQRLGPLLELILLSEGGHVPPGLMRTALIPNGAAPFVSAIYEKREQWLSPDHRRTGFVRAARQAPHGDSLFTAFLMDAKRAAHDIARLPGTTPGQLVGAMEEMENNIHEHSEAQDTGILAFRAVPGVFEFVVADGGIGILNSLRKCDLFATLSDHGAALQMALTDGMSRFGPDSNRGHGFRPIFIGLVNLRGSLRFRSGDHALLMDGTSPDLATAQLAQKPMIDGFFASVSCDLGVALSGS